ncbi:hypothetical protein DFH06DRAFT_1145313 [Mycena polygramma]|nr:hypothetical protein DFH06DRAFT_1145313 [Mycena polygramma]
MLQYVPALARITRVLDKKAVIPNVHNPTPNRTGIIAVEVVLQIYGPAMRYQLRHRVVWRDTRWDNSDRTNSMPEDRERAAQRNERDKNVQAFLKDLTSNRTRGSAETTNNLGAVETRARAQHRTELQFYNSAFTATPLDHGRATRERKNYLRTIPGPGLESNKDLYSEEYGIVYSATAHYRLCHQTDSSAATGELDKQGNYRMAKEKI